jgi:hypothetical protein
MEAPPTEQELREAFARIEVAVEGGNRDLAGLGFWRMVARVKPDPELSDRWAEQIGRIDGMAFRAGVRLRIPVWAGNLLLLTVVLAGAAAVVIGRIADNGTIAGLAFIAAAGLWALGIHCLAHWVVGRAVGIRFTDYFLGGPFPPRPGLKTDYASYLRTPPSSRAAMHAAGAIATKLAPFVALAFVPGSAAPWWAAVALVVIGVGQIASDLVFSVKSSDWKKVKRERAVARARAAGPSRAG